jgi:peptidoglycan/xylan/chitin deacetylase (PgdA/CDA1 family)
VGKLLAGGKAAHDRTAAFLRDQGPEALDLAGATVGAVTERRRRLRAAYVRERSRGVAVAKRAIYATVRRTGLPALAARTYARGRVGILVYHNPTPELLDEHLRWLAPRVSFITLDRLVDAIGSPAWDELPPRSLVVTVDDGHAGNYALRDVFRRHGVRPTIFACSQIVGTRRRYWWTVDGIDRRVLFAADNETRLTLLAERHGFRQEDEHAGERQALSREEVAELLDYVDFQAHTRFHPILTACSDEECRREIELSRQEVADLTGRDVRHFAYPNGRFGEREVELLRAAGYRSARTVELGWNDRDTDPYRLRMIGVPDDASIDQLATQLAGIPFVRGLMFIS